MLTCLFFDLRLEHVRATLLTRLRSEALHATRGNTLLLAHMVGNALSHEPPLGLFGRIVTPRSGEHRCRVDVKLHPAAWPGFRHLDQR